MKAVLVAAMCLGLAGCGGGLFGLGGGGEPVTASETTTRPMGVPIEYEPGCPAIDVIENAAAYRGGQGAGSASGVAFQASLTNFARECFITGNQLRLKVGIEGRVLLGQNGRPGTFQVPVRIVVKRRAEIVAQRASRVSVTIPGNETQAEFAYVDENIVLAITANDPADEYDIFVGLDPTSAQTAAARRRR